MTAFLKNVVDPFGLGKDDDMGTTFITSGTSVIGYRVAKGLLDAGYKHIRVGIWKGERQLGVDKSIGQKVLEELEEKGATVIVFDWTDEEQYKMALAGVNTVFCTLPHIKGFPDTFDNFLKACRKAHVEHFVKLSYIREGADAYKRSVPLVQFHRNCDALLEETRMDSRMNYTLLCASNLMSTPLITQGPALREKHQYTTASYAMGVNYVSPNDVARAAVSTLVNRKKHRNKVYNFSGPLPILDKSVAVLLGKFYDAEIEHDAIGYHEYEEVMTKRGYPDWYVKDLAMFEKVKASGVDEKASSYTKDLEEVIGKKPERFKDYLEDKDSMTLQENPATSEEL